MNRGFVFLLLLFPFCLSAQAPAGSLSLQEAERQFTGHNLELIAGRYDIDIADAHLLQARLFENPVVTFEQNVYNRINGRYFDFGKEGESAAGIEQLIYIAGQRNKRIRLEKLNKQMAVYLFEEVLKTLRAELRTKFVELYYSRKSVTVYEEEIGSLSRLLAIYKEQQTKGNVSVMEKARLQALLLSLQQERNELENRIIGLQGDLALLLGVNGAPAFEPVLDESVLARMDLSAVPFDGLRARMYERPGLKLAQTNIHASEADVKLQQSLAFPEVTLKGTYDKAGNFINDYFAIGFSVSLPVFNRNQGNIKAARIAVLQNTQRELYARQQAEKELFGSYARLEKAIRLYRSSNDEMERDFATIISGVDENFRKRHISLLEFVDYYQTCKEACLQLYQIRQDLFQAMEEVNTVTGNVVFDY